MYIVGFWSFERASLWQLEVPTELTRRVGGSCIQ